MSESRLTDDLHEAMEVADNERALLREMKAEMAQLRAELADMEARLHESMEVIKKRAGIAAKWAGNRVP